MSSHSRDSSLAFLRMQEGGLIVVVLVLGELLTLFGGSVQRRVGFQINVRTGLDPTASLTTITSQKRRFPLMRMAAF